MARTINNRIVEPDDSPLELREAIDIFARAGWAAEDARWLAPLCLANLRPDTSAESLLDPATGQSLSVIAGAAELASPRNQRDRALLIAYARLCGCGGTGGQLAQRIPKPVESGTPDAAKIARVFRDNGANFEGALISGGWPGDYGTDADLSGPVVHFARGYGDEHQPPMPELVHLMRLLFDKAAVALSSVIDEGALVAAGSKRALLDPARSPRVPPAWEGGQLKASDARSLTNWMIGVGPRALTAFFPKFAKSPNDQSLAALAIGVQDAIERWLLCRAGHWSYFSEGGPELAAACHDYLGLLQQRVAIPESDAATQLRRSWLWFAHCVYEADPELWRNLPPQEQEHLLRAATEDLARFRPLFSKARLRSQPPTGEGWGPLLPGETREPWEEFEWVKEHFRTCAVFLYEFGGVWRGMKPLLLALRSLASPSVASDLRYWADPDREALHGRPIELVQPPEPWRQIPSSMVNLFHGFVHAEQEKDPELVSLRGELARFCLERLADRWTKSERAEAEQTGRTRTDHDMLERSPEWRLCLVRAVASLYINPEGMAQRILQRSSQIDPHEEVRQAANAAYQQMRRLTALPENVSPRRAVMSALWWIRQAHLLALGYKIDADGAQRTRAKELTRTKESERADAPAD